MISNISIHAPSRERPKDDDELQELFEISIHAPSRERLDQQKHCLLIGGFQSTLPRGSDLQPDVIVYAGQQHFNPRSLAGATRIGKRIVYAGMDFNPRSLAGATDLKYLNQKEASVFQSTLPRGSDTMMKVIMQGLIIFQSTLPRGSDMSRLYIGWALPISIHAPSRERPTANRNRSLLGRNFNPRSLAGATMLGMLHNRYIQISIHAPSRERLSYL